jgi:4-carboxymuconolactone decarboxylase
MTSSESKSRMPVVHREQLTESQLDLVQRLEAERGRVPSPFRIWIHNPAIAEPLHELGVRLTEGVKLSMRERELAVLLIAHHWGAEYVMEVHSKMALESGLPPAVVAEICSGKIPQMENLRERSVCDIVADFLRKIVSSDGTFNGALSTLGQGGLAELLVLCGYFTSISLAMKLYRMPLPAK